MAGGKIKNEGFVTIGWGFAWFGLKSSIML
jgi:hypothetical protein